MRVLTLITYWTIIGVNTFVPIEKCAIIFVIGQVESF